MRKIAVETTVPIRLSKWLAGAFPSMSKGTVTTALRKKDVRVNGRRIREDVELSCGDEVTLYISDEKLLGVPLEVIWLSESLIVPVKPAGVLTKADGEADMEARASKWLESRGEPPLALACHRLDSGTGGLLMLARSLEAEATVRDLMERGKIRKTYHCIVRGTPEPSRATLTAYMKKDIEKGYVSVFDKPVPGAKTAITEYVVLQTDGACSLLEIILHTGRTHQIRAHMAHIGHPVLGDDKYGDRAFNREYKARRQKLWACRLEFQFSPGECPLLGDLAGRVLESTAPFDLELSN